ncbi:uracil-DNA glycosylase family protein [Sphingomonas crocodyli]|uniref:Uracil-DNA glycosylase n=1 Tax=Sphingomonas crocodyli TaxID=1979270 RepID=A0A437M7Y6_9SPHN|nr:uracil-DNA glycosylase family protein [Sphingomonas crocodyli]RVT93769.1 uracil-DNA glycosylase [Sphingomonas crocodyli]
MAALFAWWRDAGLDCFVEDVPRDWLTPPVKAVVRAAPVEVSTPSAPAPSAPVAAPPPAPAALPDSLDALQAWLATSDAIRLPTAGRIAPAGDPASGVMMMVDQPEPDDAEAGQLMAGEIGRLFDRMMAAIGRDRASIYLAAMAPARPIAGHVDAALAHHLGEVARRHVSLARPRALLLFGDQPARALLGKGTIEARGRVHDVQIDGGATRVIATFHPRHLLRHPAHKAHAWADLQLLMKTLGQ